MWLFSILGLFLLFRKGSNLQPSASEAVAQTNYATEQYVAPNGLEPLPNTFKG